MTDSNPTIMDVAAAAGVSRSTASRVLTGSSAVSPEAVAAVQRAVAELRYVPNRAAKSLASRQTYAIGLIVPEETERLFGDPYFAAIISGVNDRVLRSDYVLTLLLAVDDPAQKMTSYVRAGTIDGAIVVSHHTSDTFIDAIAASVPLVYGGRPTSARETDFYVDVDNADGARQAVEYLIGLGRRRIATITGPGTMPAGVDRLAGYREALAAAGLAEGAVADGGFTASGGARAMREILAGQPRPDALFVASDLMASGALTVLRTLGVDVPGDIAIVGFDDSPIAAELGLTTVRQPSFDAGVAVADLLLRRLAGESPAPVVILPTELVVRASA